MSDIITVNDLNLWYGPTQALHHVTISVPEHSITALIGPSGCGKSTFLKTLDRMNDLIPGVKVEGQVLYKGQDIYAPGVDVSQLRREVGMVFQKPNPFPMSIYDNVAYGPRTHGIRNKAKLDELVEQSLRRAAIWDEVKDRLKKSALGLSGVSRTAPPSSCWASWWSTATRRPCSPRPAKSAPRITSPGGLDNA